MSAKKQVAIISNSSDYATIRRFISAIEKDWSIEIIRANNFQDYDFHSQYKKGVIIVFISKGKHISELGEYIEKLDLKQNRVLALTSIMNPKIEKSLTEIGCSNVYLQSVNIKHFNQALEVYFTAITAKNRTVTKEVAALNLKADCWILEDLTHIKKIKDTWFIKLLGPSSKTGNWLKSGEYGREDYWEFIPNDPVHESLKGEPGTWFFKGNKPKQEGVHWNFIGEQIELIFLAEGIIEFSKFKITANGSQLLIARNSEFAKDKIDAIENSFVTEFKSKAKRKQLEDLKGKINSPFLDKINDRLEGTVNTQQSNEPEKTFDKKPKSFKLIETKDEKIQHLDELSTEEKKIVVWTKNQELVVKATAVKVSKETYEIVFPENKKGTQLGDELKSKKHDKVFIRGNLDDGSVFFDIDSPTFKIKNIDLLVPDQMWKVQRREFIRLKLDGRKKMMAEIKLHGKNRVYTIKSPIKNIAAGGCALLVDEVHKSFFKQGKIIKEIKFIINNYMIITSGCIKWTSKLHKSEVLQNFDYALGIQFVYISGSDRDYINRFVLEEAYNKRESRPSL